MPPSRAQQFPLALILLGYFVAGALFAIYTPAWQTPDEPAHYNYVRHIAEFGCCPLIEDGDWDGEYLSLLTTVRFAPAELGALDTMQYEDHQPPLYYLLAAVVFRFSAGDLIALRLFSVVIGAGVVGLSYAISRRLLPHQPQVALGVMALVAFLPQHLGMLSAVNNDALAELVVALALLQLLRFLDGETVPPWQLGLIVGLAFLTKLTIYFLALLMPLAMWLRWRRDRGSPRDLARQLAVFALVAGLMGGAWWLRNIGVYGFPDVFGLAAHDAVVHDQPRSADFIAQHGFTSYLSQMAGVTFRSFWGQFGWMALPLDQVLGGWIYLGFGLFSAAGLAGLALMARRCLPTGPRLDFMLILLVALALVLLQFGYYNLEFLQWQGRYLFPALLPISVGLVCGVDAWRARFLSRWPPARWLMVLALACLFALDIYLLVRVIVPGLAP